MSPPLRPDNGTRFTELLEQAKTCLSLAELEAVKVAVLLVPVVEGGLKLAVTPLGSPVALKAKLPVNPPTRVMESVLAALAP